MAKISRYPQPVNERCPLERAILAMCDTISRDRDLREVHTVAVLAARADSTLVDPMA
jgi:hypothetical protein